MPEQIKKISKNHYSVFNSESGQVHAKSTTLAKAKKQVKLLNGLDNPKFKKKANFKKT